MNRNPGKRGVDDLRALAAEYAADALDARRRTRFEEVLRDDPQLQTQVAALRALWNELPDRAPEAAPAALWPLVRSRLGRARVVALPYPVPRWRMAVSFAAGVVVGILAWTLATGGPSPSTAAEEELMAHESLFETLDPFPPESIAGLYFTAVPVDREPTGGPR